MSIASHEEKAFQRKIDSESNAADLSLSTLKVAYLMNQHPSPSVTFIRREIAGLESKSATVVRYSIRRWSGEVVDPADKAEATRTEVLLDRGLLLFWDLLCCIVSSPRRFFTAARLCACVGWKSDRGPFLTWIYLLEACSLKRRVTRANIPWIHAHFGTNSTAVAMFCRVLGGPPYSFTVHGPEEFDRPELLHLGEKIKHAGMVIAISNFCRSQLYRWCRWEDWGKIRIVRCGVSETFARQTHTPVTNLPTLVCVARLAEQKGLPILLEAAARLKRSGVDFQLRVIGDGVLRKPLEMLIAQEGLQDHVLLMGWQTEKQIRQAIEESRALVLPSFAEGLPVVLMEALALGRPVISTKIAGISELVVDRENGWLVDAGDAETLESAMRDVLAADPEKLSAMGQSGADSVRSRHLAKDEAYRLGEYFLELQSTVR
jgi:colanic acid/amylovoran biosynthesis glycosyltransferase